MDDSTIFWPFYTLPFEQLSVQGQNEVRFFENAFAQGFQPYVFGSYNYGLSFDNRTATVYYRAPYLWEVVFAISQDFALTVYLKDFTVVAQNVIHWLQNADISMLIRSFYRNIREVGHAPGGMIFRDQSGLHTQVTIEILLGANLPEYYTIHVFKNERRDKEYYIHVNTKNMIDHTTKTAL
jgi:hypothetical protein